MAQEEMQVKERKPRVATAMCTATGGTSARAARASRKRYTPKMLIGKISCVEVEGEGRSEIMLESFRQYVNRNEDRGIQGMFILQRGELMS